MRIKDIITTVLLAVCNIVIFLLVSITSITPVTLVLQPVFYALVQGIVFFVLGTRVKKKGAVLLYCFIQGAICCYIPYVIGYTIAGILAEIILAKTGYGKMTGLTISYVLVQVCACLAGTVYPFVFALEATMERQANSSREYSITEVISLLSVGGTIGLVALTIVAALAGAFIGSRILKKHLITGEAVM